MFGKRYVRHLVSRSAENPTDRRRFLRTAGAAGLGLVGAGVTGATLMTESAGNSTPEVALENTSNSKDKDKNQYGYNKDDAAASDAAVLNFALNLEFLEANLYSFAINGYGVPGYLTDGVGKKGGVSGGHAVKFESDAVKQIVKEIADDELAHVKFLRGALGKAAVAQPKIDFKDSFTAAAQAAGLIQKGQTFDPFASEPNLLVAAYLFEDVGVSAYKGAAPLVNNKTFLDAAAGILAVEAYHAGIIRTKLFDRGLGDVTNKISDARNALAGNKHDDQGVLLDGKANLVLADGNGIAFGRGADRVLNIAYLNPKKVKSGGFYPDGVNGDINTSGGY
ncbi:MAG TPA: ferritin-like domain-containing protein [Amycolatopsis sp.]|uniref:ferritin-like domain-containing protein n=1 Tax=Amycolatopsis sp. TaxID=37632 RepID=UPI002B4629C1|nr:ferritin-like domain-containing protein [Amycolatopsis sp.]HKS49776.1 ferritin-like domain-containing protein [Amycolatopsis sp.]